MSKFRHLEDQIFDENLILERIGYKLSRIFAGQKAFRKLRKQYANDQPKLATFVDSKDNVTKYVELSDFNLPDWELTVYLNDILQPSQIMFEAEKIERVKRYLDND